jgi:hypothetical protein
VAGEGGSAAGAAAVGAVMVLRQFGQGPVTPAMDAFTVRRVWQEGQEKVRVSNAIGGSWA